MIAYAAEIGCQVDGCRKPGTPHHVKKRSQGGTDVVPDLETRTRGNIMGACITDGHHQKADQGKLAIVWEPRGWRWVGIEPPDPLKGQAWFDNWPISIPLKAGHVYCGTCGTEMRWKNKAWRCLCPELAKTI